MHTIMVLSRTRLLGLLVDEFRDEFSDELAEISAPLCAVHITHVSHTHSLSYTLTLTLPPCPTVSHTHILALYSLSLSLSLAHSLSIAPSLLQVLLALSLSISLSLSLSLSSLPLPLPLSSLSRALFLSLFLAEAGEWVWKAAKGAGEAGRKDVRGVQNQRRPRVREHILVRERILVGSIQKDVRGRVCAIKRPSPPGARHIPGFRRCSTQWNTSQEHRGD